MSFKRVDLGIGEHNFKLRDFNMSAKEKIEITTLALYDGYIILTAYLRGNLIHKARYLGYSKSEAKVKFKNELANILTPQKK